MKQLKKITLTLVALLSMTAGTWAQESNEITLTPVTGQQNQWSFTMPAGNVELTPIYAPEFTAAFKAANALTIEAGKATVSVTENGQPVNTATLADGKLSPLYQGQTVILKASEGYKFRKVEVKKKEPAEGHALTSATVGMIVGSDGKAYAADDKDNLPEGVTAVAKVCYVDGNGHGLALALADDGYMDWSTAKTACAAHTPAITGGTWKLASQTEWNNMISAAGSYTALREGFSSVGGTNMQSDYYWSSTESGSDVWHYDFDGCEDNWRYDGKEGLSEYVRACLAF